MPIAFPGCSANDLLDCVDGEQYLFVRQFLCVFEVSNLSYFKLVTVQRKHGNKNMVRTSFVPFGTRQRLLFPTLFAALVFKYV